MDQTNAAPKYVMPARDDPDRGSKLRDIREKMGLTREVFAASVGMSPGTLARWETKNNFDLPFGRLIHRKVKMFVEDGVMTPKKRKPHPPGSNTITITPDNVADYIPITNRTDSDLVRELQRRGWVVTLTMPQSPTQVPAPVPVERAIELLQEWIRDKPDGYRFTVPQALKQAGIIADGVLVDRKLHVPMILGRMLDVEYTTPHRHYTTVD